MNVKSIPNFFYIFALLFIVYKIMLHHNVYTSKEAFDGLLVENAFSDTKCVSDDLPLVKFHPRDAPNTFRCLSVDGVNCMDRNTVGIPAAYTCNDARKNVNFYLTVDGLRNVKVNPNLPISKVFNDFENLRLLPESDGKLNKNMKYLTCNPDGLSDPNHWCGKLWNKINSQCSTPKGKYGEYQGVCKSIPQFINGGNVGAAVQVVGYETIAANQKAAVLATQNARRANPRAR
jgi:hypothetical protein